MKPKRRKSRFWGYDFLVCVSGSANVLSGLVAPRRSKRVVTLPFEVETQKNKNDFGKLDFVSRYQPKSTNVKSSQVKSSQREKFVMTCLKCLVLRDSGLVVFVLFECLLTEFWAMFGR